MRRAIHLWPFALVFLSLAVSRCDGEWSFVIPAWDAGVPSARYASTCRAWAKRFCDHSDRCPLPIYARWTSHAECMERSTLSCELVAGDPNVSFDADAAAACSFSTDCSAPWPSFFCLSQGRSPVDAACVWSESCQTLSCQRTVDEMTQRWPICGVCRPVTTCDPGCPAGTQCSSVVDGGVACTPVPTVGQPCREPFFICHDSYCRREAAAGGPGVCTAWAGLGEACGDGLTGSACGPIETYCDDTLHCRPYSPAAYGQPCVASKGGSGYVCTAYGSCDFANTGLCVPPAPDGALCDDAQGLRCLPPATCIAHHCLLPSLVDCAL